MLNIEALKSQNCVLHWSGSSCNEFPILPDGVAITPTGTFAVQKMKDGRNVLKFDGSTNYISLSDNDAWNFGSGDLTICGWIYLASTPATYRYIFETSTGTDESNVHGIHLRGNDQKLAWFVYQSATYYWFILSENAIPTGWTHFACSRLGNTQQIFINGSQSGTTATASITINNHTAMNIGSYSANPRSNYMNGNIKDLMIFKKALTVDQIGTLYRETFIY